MKSKKIIVILLLLISTVTAFSQYVGGSSVKLYTVQEIKENASQLDKNDALVKIQGYITDRIKDDTYWFKDSSGKILVEIEKKQIPDFAFDETTEVWIVGEVDYDLLEEVEIEVEFIQLVKKQ